MKNSRYFNSKVFQNCPFWSSWERTFEVRGKLPPSAIHGWSAVEDCPRPEAGSAPNVRQYNSGACIYWSQICIKRAKIQCMFKAPFLWATIDSPSEVDLWRRRKKMHVVQVFHTRTEPHIFAGLNHAQNVQIYMVYRDHPSFKQSIICIWTALTIRAEKQANSRDSQQHPSETVDASTHVDYSRTRFLWEQQGREC